MIKVLFNIGKMLCILLALLGALTMLTDDKKQMITGFVMFLIGMAPILIYQHFNDYEEYTNG